MSTNVKELTQGWDAAQDEFEKLGVKLVRSAVHDHSTRDLAECVKADLRNHIDRGLLDELKGLKGVKAKFKEEA